MPCQAGERLHGRVVRGNELRVLLLGLRNRQGELLHLGLGLRNRSQEMQQEHRSLVKALSRGDGDTAERICREQIEAARNMVLSAILTSSSVMNLALAASRPDWPTRG